MQIAGSFFDQDFWVRKINNVVNTPWNKLLHSGNIASFNQLNSDSDFANGTLVTTDINYSGFSGDSFQIEIEGKSYFALYPWMVRGQGYIYDNSIIAKGLVDYTGNFPTADFKAFNLNGVLCFWWPRIDYWNSFSVKVYESVGFGGKTNRVTGISNSVIPGGRTREVNFPALKAMHTAGGTFTGPLSFGSSVSHPGNSTPTALSYGMLTGFGNFYINADTDGSTNEFLYLTAGRGAGATDGLRIGYETLAWRGNNVWNNMNGSGGIRFLSGGTVQNNVLFTVSGSTLTITTTTGSAI